MTTLRKPTPRDAHDLAAMVDELNAHEGDPTGHFTPDRAFEDVIAPGAPVSCLLAEEEGALVGYAFWHFGYETAWAARGSYLADLYVRAPWRGTGVADRLLRAVAAKTRDAGGSYVWWTTHRVNARARAFYRRQAFEEEGIVVFAAAHEKFQALLE